MGATSSVLSALARELLEARASGSMVAVPPSARDGAFDLAAAYAVEAELTRARRDSGRVTVGRKVGFANKAIWRALKLQTLVWANMYDDTVQQTARGSGSFSMAGMRLPRIEPEIVFKLALPTSSGDLADVLASIEWVALGFEIVDCPFPDWTFQPADFVASFGLHAGLIVGEPRRIGPGDRRALGDQLAGFTVALSKHGEVVEEGSGRNVLRSPGLCLGELASAIAARPGAEPLRPGELISTGTLTAAHAVAAGDRWQAETMGMDLPPVALHIVP